MDEKKILHKTVVYVLSGTVISMAFFTDSSNLMADQVQREIVCKEPRSVLCDEYLGHESPLGPNGPTQQFRFATTATTTSSDTGASLYRL